MSAKSVQAWVAGLALAALGGVLVGCGGSGSSPRPATSGSPLPATSGPLTKAAAVGYAHAVNLRVSDVPGMEAATVEGERERHKSTLCGVRENGAYLADLHAPKFVSGKGFRRKQISSDVEVMPTATLANEKLAKAQAAIRNPHTLACIERMSGQAFARGVTRRPTATVRIKLGRVAAYVLHPGVQASFGLRVVLPIALAAPGANGSINLTAYLDTFGFVVGPASVSLTTVSYSGPLPVTLEQRLLSLLHSRAKAHTL